MSGQPVVFDDAFFADPYPSYARLRDAGPVHRVASLESTPAWLLTRHADVRAALGDSRLSAQDQHGDAAQPSYWVSPLVWMPTELSAVLHHQQPPDHTHLRRLISPAFTLRRIAEFRPNIQKVVDRMLDGIAPQGSQGQIIDLISAFTAPLPHLVTGELHGIPDHDRAQFRDWAAQLFTFGHQADHVRRTGTELLHYLRDLIARKRTDPTDDLLSDLIAAHDTEGQLSEDQLVSMTMQIHLAGTLPTSNLISNGLLALLRQPDQLAALRADPNLLPSAVEELLRYEPPTQIRVRRSLSEDLRIGGTTIPVGQTVALLLACANRDPDRFTDPESLDVTRADNPHVSLGYGFRFCLGAPLVRMTAQITLGTLLQRFPHLRLAVDLNRLRWRHLLRLRALYELPIDLSQASTR